MRIRLIVVLLAVTGIVAALYFLYILPASLEKKDQADLQMRLFHGNPSEVQSIELTTPAGKISILRQDNCWLLSGDNKADEGTVDRLLEVAFSGRIVKVMKEDGDFRQFALERPGIILKLGYPEGGEVLNIGGANPLNTGYYAYSDGFKKIFLLDTELVRELNLNMFNFRDKRVFIYDWQKVGRIVLMNDDERIDLKRLDGRWSMQYPYKYSADSRTVDALVATMEIERAVGFVAWRDEFNKLERSMSMELYDLDGLLMDEITIAFWGSEGNKQILGRKNGAVEAARVRRELWNTLQREPSVYLEREMFRQAPADVRVVRVIWDGRQYVLERSNNESWVHDSKAVDSQMAERLLQYIMQIEARLLIDEERTLGKNLLSVELIDASGSVHSMNISDFDMTYEVSSTPLSYVSSQDGQRKSVQFLFSRASDLGLAALVASTTVQEIQSRVEAIINEN